MSRLRAIATAPLRFYRRFLSPWKPPMCRFSPTCSQYAIEAVEAHGILRGGGLAIWRILRCQPFARAGYDPVPLPRGHDDCAHDHDRNP
jgi:putative membrane protein insertion efficiency factor